jgi:hypothetical protein
MPTPRMITRARTHTTTASAIVEVGTVRFTADADV